MWRGEGRQEASGAAAAAGELDAVRSRHGVTLGSLSLCRMPSWSAVPPILTLTLFLSHGPAL